MLIINIDDDADARELFQRAVRTVDPAIRCELFESGKDFFDFIGTSGRLPDFIFLDINMPKKNGYECAVAIRSVKKFQEVRVVMHSTSFNPVEQAKFANLGLEFLLKPNRLSVLVQDIKDLVVQSPNQLEGIR